MKRIILVLISLLFIITFFNNCRITKKTIIDDEINFQGSPLVAYGKEIFKRESCANCHTLKIENENSQLFSIDGVGGKYSSEWLFYYLYEPQNLFPESKKNAYKNLFINPLNKEEVLTITNDIEKDKSWVRLLDEAEQIKEELKSQSITIENKEVLALISYIQQIPASKRKIEIDSLRHLKYIKELGLDSTSIIIEIANDEANSKKGEQLFEANCSSCHGMAGQGIIAPNLTDDYWLHGSEKSDIARTIIYGVPKKGMVYCKSELTPREVGELVSFISSIKGTNPENAKEPQGKKE